MLHSVVTKKVVVKGARPKPKWAKMPKTSASYVPGPFGIPNVLGWSKNGGVKPPARKCKPRKTKPSTDTSTTMTVAVPAPTNDNTIAQQISTNATTDDSNAIATVADGTTDNHTANDNPIATVADGTTDNHTANDNSTDFPTADDTFDTMSPVKDTQTATEVTPSPQKKPTPSEEFMETITPVINKGVNDYGSKLVIDVLNNITKDLAD